MISTTRWRPLIAQVAAEYTPLDPVVFEAMILTESNGNPNARSASDARGLSQIIYRHHAALVDETAKRFGVPPGLGALFNPHVSLYAGGRHLRYLYLSDDAGKRSWERAVRAYFSGSYDPPPGFVDGQRTSPDQHITKLRANLEAVRADRIDTPPEDKPMAYKKHTWPGLRNPIYLPDWIPVEIKIITNGRFRNYAKFSGQVKTTWHDTGNSRTNARGEWTWANNGRQGAGVGGYNGIFDDKVVIIAQPFDEKVWHGGTVPSYTSWAFEQAWGTGVNWEKCLEVGAAVHGGLLASQGLGISGLVQHNYWSGKDCPGQIRRRGTWSKVVAMVEAARLGALGAAGGVLSEPSGPKYVEPVHIKELDFTTLPPQMVTHDGSDFIYVNDALKATRETPRLAQAGGDDLRGAPVKVGEQFVGEWLFKADDGAYYYITPTWHTRIRAKDVERIGDLGKPEEKEV